MRNHLIDQLLVDADAMQIATKEDLQVRFVSSTLRDREYFWRAPDGLTVRLSRASAADFDFESPLRWTAVLQSWEFLGHGTTALAALHALGRRIVERLSPKSSEGLTGLGAVDSATNDWLVIADAMLEASEADIYPTKNFSVDFAYPRRVAEWRMPFQIYDPPSGSWSAGIAIWLDSIGAYWTDTVWMVDHGRSRAVSLHHHESTPIAAIHRLGEEIIRALS